MECNVAPVELGLRSGDSCVLAGSIGDCASQPNSGLGELEAGLKGLVVWTRGTVSTRIRCGASRLIL